MEGLSERMGKQATAMSLTQPIVYRLPAFRWSKHLQRWAEEPNTLVSRCATLAIQQINPADLPQPMVFPGQEISFTDSRVHPLRGMVESVMIYSCDYDDPGQRDYWIEWNYQSSMAITYWIRTSDQGLWQIYGPAIIRMQQA